MCLRDNLFANWLCVGTVDAELGSEAGQHLPTADVQQMLIYRAKNNEVMTKQAWFIFRKCKSAILLLNVVRRIIFYF